MFQALGSVLGLYSNIAIAWMMAVVADLVINKPLGLSPPGIEFKRAHLYDINPVGVGAMGAASVLSIAAYLGVLGPMAQAFSALIALVTAFVAAPLIAWATKGTYYLGSRRAASLRRKRGRGRRCAARSASASTKPKIWRIAPRISATSARCAARSTRAATTCASRRQARSSVQWAAVLRALLPRSTWPPPRNRPRPLPAADGDRRAAARRPVRSALPPRAEAARRAGRSVARAGAASCRSSRPSPRCC